MQLLKPQISPLSKDEAVFFKRRYLGENSPDCEKNEGKVKVSDSLTENRDDITYNVSLGSNLSCTFGPLAI